MKLLNDNYNSNNTKFRISLDRNNSWAIDLRLMGNLEKGSDLHKELVDDFLNFRCENKKRFALDESQHDHAN